MDSTLYVNNLFNLTGHTGIVTGASRGIGMGIAKVLCGAGAKVYNLSRSIYAGEENICEGMENIPVDITNLAKTKEIIDDIAAKEGHLDFLVNNAGMTYKARAEEFPQEEYQRIQNLNLKAMFDLSRQAYPYLKESRYTGRIVNISSMASYMGFTGVVPYCMTKAGVTGLTRGLAQEWRKEPILVNSVAPGWFLTKLNEELFASNPDRKEAALNKITLERFGDPAEVGHMVLFLLSGASTYLTGQDFAVDGGALSHGF